mgnify:CR=1 FL=1
MSNEFGYIPESPEQSFGNNKGIFTPTDIYDLTRADKYTNYGQLELIETQTFSGVSTVDFTSIQESTYNVHFLTLSDIKHTSASGFTGLQFYESGVLETANVYQRATQYNESNGTNGELKSTGDNEFLLTYNVNGLITGDLESGYVYLYNLGDSSKYSFMTQQVIFMDNTVFKMSFGSGVLPQASTVDGFRLQFDGADTSGTVSLYGIKEYS